MNKLIKSSVFVLAILLTVSLSVVSAPPGMKDVTFKYEPQIEDVTQVYLAGSFNNWSTDKLKMLDQDGDGVYEITISLKPGAYQYKFVVNGTTWRKDPYSEDYAPDGFGGLNSVINVGQQIEQTGVVGDGEIIKNALWHNQAVPAHITLLKDNMIEIRFQTALNDVENVRINFFDEDGYQVEFMNHFTFDEQFDHWSKTIEVTDQSFRYRFVIDDADTRFWYGKQGISLDMPPWFSFNKEDQVVFSTPEWVRAALFYQIFPDRFYNGNRENDPEYIETYKNNKERYQNIVPDWDQGIKNSDHHWIDPKDFTDNNNRINPMSGWHLLYGGDLQGIEEKFDYLTDLGINAIYLNPIFEATSNHKYNSSGYEFIEDNFAFKGDTERSNKYFAEFIKKAHQNEIRIVLDGVFNHTGYEHYAFQDVIENGENSKYWDWYYIKSYPINTLYEQRTEGIAPNYESWAGFGSLPKLNVNNQEVQNYIFEVTQKWMDPNNDGNPEDGIDGWRLDVPNEVKDRNPEFWIKWRSYVKSINPDTYIVGEIWGDGSEYLKGNEFDAVMNYRFRDAVLQLLKDDLSKKKFVNEINKIKADYPKPAFYSLLNLIDSHDTERFLNSLDGDKEKFKIAVFFQYIFPGAPVIYYGDEIGLEGGEDPDNRRTMVWENRDYLDKPDQQLRSFYKKLINIRKNNQVLTNGDIMVSTDQENDDIIIIKRSYEQEKIVGIVNLGTEYLSLKYNIEDKLAVTDLITGKKYSIENNRLEVELSKNQIMLIRY